MDNSESTFISKYSNHLARMNKRITEQSIIQVDINLSLAARTYQLILSKRESHCVAILR